MNWRFGPFDLDDERFELRRDGAPVELRRKVFDVLRYLLAHRDRLVTKEELMGEVWPGVVVQEAVITQNVAILRKLLGDSRQAGKVIQTVHGRGYRFVAEVVVGTAPRVGPSTPPARGEGEPFVGREHSMRELRRLLDEARAGRGRLVVVTGDAGIGKTRVLEALANEARMRGMGLLEGRCHEGPGAPAYWPWIQILRAAAGEAAEFPGRRSRVDVDAAKLLGQLRATPDGHLARPEAHLAGDTRFRFFDEVGSWLARLARVRPLLVTIDDLHWADEATLLLVRFLAREVRALPLLLVAAARGVDVRSTPDLGPLTTLLRETHAERLYLEGLSLETTGALVEATLGRGLDAARVRELHAVSEGNPFFLRELLQLFAEAPGAKVDDDRIGRELPRRVRELVALRMRALDDEARRVVSEAAVIGDELDVGVLERVVDLPRDRLLALLDAAVATRIVRGPAPRSPDLGVDRTASGSYAFSHALIRESLYDALPETERTRLHDRVGRALESRFGTDLGAHLDELAHHASLAVAGGDVERAVSFCTRAAEHALSALAFERSVVWYERALRALESRLPVEEETRFRLVLALGGARFRAGGDGNPALLRAAEIARRLGHPERIGDVALVMAGWPRVVRHGRTANPALEPLIEEALASSLADAPVLRARLLAARALNGPEGTTLAERVALAESAIALAREAANDEALFDALVARLRLPQAPEHTRDRLRIADDLASVAARLDRPESRFTAHALRVGPRIALGEIARADEDIAACAALGETLRLPHTRLQVLRFRLERAFGDGRFDELRPLSREAASVRGEAQQSIGTPITLYIWPTLARVLRGDRSWFDRQIADFVGAVALGPSMRGFVAYLYAAFDHFADARACYAPLLEPETLDDARDDDWLMTVAFAAEAISACGDREAAFRVYPRLFPHAALNVSHEEWLIYFGSCAHWLGALAALLGEHDAALSHFESALAANRALGARPALARTSLAYARALLAPGRGDPSPADRRRAQVLLRDALALADELGMQPTAADARALVV